MLSFLRRNARTLSLLLSKAEAPAKRIRIKKAEVKRLSLCRQAKNGLRTLYKADGTLQLDALVKAVDEGTLLAVVYAPERADADGHIADPNVVRGMLHSLMRNGAELDIEHDGKVLPREKAYIAEAFTVQKADPRFAGWKNYDGTDAGDLTGAAAVQINIDDPALRASRIKGDWDGVSLFGVGEGVPEQVITKSTSQPEDTMTPEQLKALQDSFSAGLASLQTALVKSISDAVKPAEPKKDEPAKPDPIAELTAQVAELRKALGVSSEEKEAGVESADNAEVRDLKLRLFKAKRKSNAPASGAREPEKTQIELDLAEGLELAKSLTGEAKAVSGWKIH